MHFAWRLLASCTILITGCSVANIATKSPVSEPVAATANTPVKGMARGGQQPIQGAFIYMYAAGMSAYGGPSVSLLNSNTGNVPDGNGNYYVTTDTNGVFTIAADDYSCTGGQQVYLYSAGGNPQVGGGDNSAAGLMAVLGQCGTGSSFSGLPATVQMDEVTTVAAAYALAGFATDATHISGSNSTLAATGMANAAMNAANLANLGTGLALTTTPAGNGTVPQSEINTLANILAACINTTGPGSSGCTTLFSNAKNGSTEPTDTATAAINIAHNPAVSVTPLWNLSTSTAPFQPSLTSSAPNDWTIAVSYTGGGLNSPVPVAIDASGNVWIGNTATGANSVSELSPVGATISGSPFSGGGIVDPYSIAIDKFGDVWTANITPDSLSELSSTGTPVSTSAGYTGGGLNAPYAIAFDQLGDVWVVNNVGSSLSEFSSAGLPITGSSGYTGGGISNDPVSLAIDASGDIWVTDSITLGALSEFNSTGLDAGSPISPSAGFTGGGLNDPWGLAIDASGNVWAANSGSGADSISKFGSSGSPISSSTGYTGGGLNIPEGIAIDGAGNVWVVNRASTQFEPPYPDSSISEFSSSGTAISPSTGYQAGLNISLRIAVDGSGNVWVSNATLNTVTEFVGAGAPVVTPIVANLLTPYSSHAVNKP
jgi:hypothetical protein